MKQLLAVLLCLLLCGCAPQTHPETETAAETEPAAVSMYDPDHPMALANPGTVRAYPLALEQVQGIRPFGKHVLVLSGNESTTLTLLTGDALKNTASVTLDFGLSPEDPSLRSHPERVSFFDPLARETVVLDSSLQEVRRIASPDNLSGKPLLSHDGGTLYYCTPWAVMAWDLDSGIRRTLRELSHESQEVSGLLLSGAVVQCTVRDGEKETLLFLSGDNGMELETLSPGSSVTAGDARYFAALPAGKMTLLVYGIPGSQPRMLLPEQFQDSQFYLAEDHAAVMARNTGSAVFLDYYELDTGLHQATLELPAHPIPRNIINCKGHGLYILAHDPEAGCHTLYRWDVLQQLPEAGNFTDHTVTYSPADEPDPEDLATCQEYADAIAQKYGITVRIGEEAAALEPWDYRFEPEYLAPILQRELKTLEESLALYPEPVLRKTIGHFSGLTVSLVRQITGTPESGSLSTATGIQFLREDQACVTVAAGKYARQALFHELYHVMETHILAESIGLDQWETLNPAMFAYGTDQPDTDVYLRGETRAFVDRYSMSIPKEDRARIFEYAMLAGQEDLFRSEYMQRKLTAVCTAIREAYGLKKHTGILPWEQYLITPLAPAA